MGSSSESFAGKIVELPLTISLNFKKSVEKYEIPKGQA